MKSLINNDVNLGGVQDITGEKTLFRRVNFRFSDNAALSSGAVQVYSGGTMNIGLKDTDDNYISHLFFRPNGELQLYGDIIAPASSLINRVVTQTALSKSVNGSLKLGCGIIIQWGTATQTAVTFPTPFSSSSSYGLSTTYGQSIASDHQYGCYYNATSTGFKVTMYNAESTARWIAIGY